MRGLANGQLALLTIICLGMGYGGAEFYKHIKDAEERIESTELAYISVATNEIDPKWEHMVATTGEISNVESDVVAEVECGSNVFIWTDTDNIGFFPDMSNTYELGTTVELMSLDPYSNIYIYAKEFASNTTISVITVDRTNMYVLNDGKIEEAE
jgi:hypothetical protein